MAENGKPFGPLHGLPISVKEHIGLEGLGLNAGYVAWYGRVGEVDARLLEILRQAGAVFHARTTQPQTLMHLETDNNLYGITTNPFNTDLSAGGSSGGEGALVGTRGSCLGIGTDIGGKHYENLGEIEVFSMSRLQVVYEVQQQTMVSMALNQRRVEYRQMDGLAPRQVPTQSLLS